MHLIPTPPSSTKPPNYRPRIRRRMYRPAVNLIEKVPDESSCNQHKECDKPKTEEELRILFKEKTDEIKNDRVRYYSYYYLLQIMIVHAHACSYQSLEYVVTILCTNTCFRTYS